MGERANGAPKGSGAVLVLKLNTAALELAVSKVCEPRPLLLEGLSPRSEAYSGEGPPGGSWGGLGSSSIATALVTTIQATATSALD
jgi:hypothetical protein